MKVEKTSTALVIREPSDVIKRKCLQYFSLDKPLREYFIYTGKDEDNKSIFNKEKDVIYISSGFAKINDQVIQKELGKIIPVQARVGKSIKLEMTREPRSQLQKDCITKLTTSPSEKITVELRPGTGKTFIALYSIAKLGVKPLIVTPSTLLKNQWIENLTDSGIPSDNIASDIYDSVHKDFCVVTITSLENAMRDDWYKLMKTLSDAQFGIRITDESHLHLKGLLKLDGICNIKHNWYLSATLGRSDFTEDKVLNRALLDADRFVGNSIYAEYQKEYVNVYFQDIYYYPSAKLCGEYFKYGTKGLIRSTYYNMLMNYKGGKPFINNVITLIKRTKTIVSYGKVLILLPMITIIDTVMEAIKQDPYFSKFSCVKVDGSLSIAKKRDALENDIILSTTMSMGCGVDVSNLGAVINFDQYASLVSYEQVVGRLRDRGVDTYYIDVCDYVKYAKTIASWGRKRRTCVTYFSGVKAEIKMLPKIRC